MRNNPVVSSRGHIMRFRLTLALALGLSFLSWGMTSRHQDAADAVQTTGQAPPATAPAQSPSEPAPTAQAPATLPAASAPDADVPAEKKAPESDAKGKTEPASASPDSTERDSATPATKPDSAKPDPATTDSTKPDSAKPGSHGTAPSSANAGNGATKHSQRSASAPAAAPRKIVVRQGGAKEPATQIAPGMTPAEAARERQNAEQWLRSTGDQLPRLAELADARQQETVVQIRNYMDGARSALTEGDVRRASTLAEKAHLLAEDLLKR